MDVNDDEAWIEYVLILFSIALALNSICVVAMYGSPYAYKTSFFSFDISKISFPSSTNHLLASLNSPLIES